MFELMNKNYLNPFRAMDEFERNAFHGFFDRQDLAEFKTDVSDEGDHYLLETDLPGFDKKDIGLSVQDNMLTITAERRSRFEDKDNQNKAVRVERSYGSYSRQFDLTGIDVDHITAKYDNGVLVLTLPKRQEVVPETRRLEIQ